LSFDAPQTGLNEQTWLDENKPPLPGQTVESLLWRACTRLHFIDVSTGKTIGQRDE
jgi:hypothetical protein